MPPKRNRNNHNYSKNGPLNNTPPTKKFAQMYTNIVAANEGQGNIAHNNGLSTENLVRKKKNYNEYTMKSTQAAAKKQADYNTAIEKGRALYYAMRSEQAAAEKQAALPKELLKQPPTNCKPGQGCTLSGGYKKLVKIKKSNKTKKKFRKYNK